MWFRDAGSVCAAEAGKGQLESKIANAKQGWKGPSRGLASALAYVLVGAQVAQANCFVQSDISRVTPAGWKVDMPSNCPGSNTQKTYLYFPQTSCTPLDLT